MYKRQLYDGQRELLDQLDRFKRNEYILDKSGKENSPKFSANFEGPDTPEQFAAALYDYMAELEAAGMLQHPYSLDPREQTLSLIHISGCGYDRLGKAFVSKSVRQNGPGRYDVEKIKRAA